MSTKPKIVILGSTGMIGSGVTNYLSSRNFEITEVNRSGYKNSSTKRVVKLDVTDNSLPSAFDQFEQGSIFVNLIGIIRHKIENSLTSHQNVKVVNSVFPKNLVKFAKLLNSRVLQIATDCIYSGKKGKYSELDKADPIDIYGYSKMHGETDAENLLTWRVSVIGHELTSNFELLDWVLSQPLGANINGYINHFWNGITTLHLAKLIESEILNSTYGSGTFHIVPGDYFSKHKLIAEISRIGNRPDLHIEETRDHSTVDRTLTTIFPIKNRQIWSNAGYSEPPSISMMLNEYFNWEKSLSKGS